MAESLIRVRNLAGALVLETSHSDSLEELQKKTSEACGAPAGILRFVKDNEPLTTLENVTDEVVLIVDESPYYSWEIARNPDRQYLKGSEAMVEFVDPQNLSHPDYVNVLSQVPIEQGVHFVEFVMHSLMDEQWCGVTFFDERAGCRGGNVPGCYYYSGRRSSHTGHLDASRERNHRLCMEHVKSGDTIGLLLDANRGAALFSLNGIFQGGSKLPKRPMYLCTALDVYGDLVELKRRDPEEFPVQLEEAMKTPLFSDEDFFDRDYDHEEALRWDPWPRSLERRTQEEHLDSQSLGDRNMEPSSLDE
eukprot:Skav222524  [mRNA]  locus=scaffold2875:43364:44281:+ [translate_table: standard]